MGSVIYLTGVPGTGKTALSHAVAAANTDVVTFSYSEHLARSLGADRQDLRRESASLVRREAVAAVDEELVRFAADERVSKSVLIDSHAVTYEDFGFRAIPFAPDLLEALRPSAVVCLSAGAAVIAARVEATPEGRRIAHLEKIEQALHLQESVAVTYALVLGVPLYIIDATAPLDTLVTHFNSILSRL